MARKSKPVTDALVLIQKTVMGVRKIMETRGCALVAVKPAPTAGHVKPLQVDKVEADTETGRVVLWVGSAEPDDREPFTGDLLQQIVDKCAQYWNSYGVGDEEYHAALSFIHTAACDLQAQTEGSATVSGTCTDCQSTDVKPGQEKCDRCANPDGNDLEAYGRCPNCGAEVGHDDK